ncbi:PVC-type heme-binding CxxCH protein [Tautonia plasticadhaerens]|uniref:Cytochrome c n=1 Tax=Tautonia plasticadhaerens TaxID=2527974 RepID=A0A518HDI8_9BACT|nr:PVC-type heme-binding CxxCH protein [Tautonia plasticadhaerens]QDV38756.1 Cytochrome c [Tautonia plasticadhaerens]
MRAAATTAALLLLPLLAAPAARSGEVVRLGDHTFSLPDGLTVEVAAGPPLVERPITAAFDERGRLYVAESSGSNDPVQVQLEEKPHRILRLEDVDGDGAFDRRTVFADGMMFPEGTMWLDGSLYVSAPPQIWRLTDLDDDGEADAREVWLDAKTLTGCANDLHGPYAGPDGWIYWCKGAFAEQTYERAGGDPFVTRASHVFRWRPDRSGPIEPVMTGGMDNPVDVAFTPGGERIFTTTFFQQPAGGFRDGLIHALYGGVYGKVHDVLDGHPRSRPGVLPVLTHLGPAAPAGLERLRSTSLGDGYRDSLLACQFNLRAVSRHVLTPEGGSFATSDSDLIASDNTDFHPTDILEDADGSVLVVDTGGWYKLCCPTSQLWKPDVLGAIYRVRRVDAPEVDDPRGLGLDWDGATADQLAARLGDPRPAVRERAVGTLGLLGAESIPALESTVRESAEAEARRNAVWAGSRINDPEAREVARIALQDEDETVVQAALHVVSVHRDRGALDRAVNLLHTGTPQNRRAAAEAVGRLGDPSAVPFLLQAAADVPEAPHWAVMHSITYALIELADPDATRFGLSAPHDTVRRAALVALDQMPGDHFSADDVSPLLSAEDPELREAAAWVASRHPEWGAALAEHFGRQILGIGDATEGQGDALADQLARLGSSPEIQDVIADALLDAGLPDAPRVVALRAMASADLDPAPPRWVDAVAAALDGDPALRSAALAAARSLRIPEGRADDLRSPLLRIARDDGAEVATRLDALASLPGGTGKMDGDLFTFLLDRLDPDAPAAEQTRAADLIAASDLSEARRLALADRIAEAGPLSVPRLLPAFETQEGEALGLRLVSALERSPSRSVLRPGDLRTLLDRFGPAVAGRASTLIAAIDADAEQKREKIEDLLTLVDDADIRRGQAVFNGEKGACRTCHAMGYVGGRVGPDLTRIGRIRTERDLLEAIAYPSASFVRSYEPVVVATVDGRVLTGLVGDEGADHVILQTNAEESVRIPRSEIEEFQPGTTSVMPAGLDQQLTPQELADLVKFLKSSQ